MTTLLGTVIHATTAQMQCMVPLYTMMMSVVSVLRRSLTTILAHAPNAACKHRDKHVVSEASGRNKKSVKNKIV